MRAVLGRLPIVWRRSKKFCSDESPVCHPQLLPMLNLKHPSRIISALVLMALFTGMLGASSHDATAPGHAYDDGCFVVIQYGACNSADTGSPVPLLAGDSLRGAWSQRLPLSTAIVGLPAVRAPPVRRC